MIRRSKRTLSEIKYKDVIDKDPSNRHTFHYSKDQ